MLEGCWLVAFIEEMPDPRENVTLNHSNEGYFELSFLSAPDPEEVEPRWWYYLAEMREEPW